jgi:Family of unknown function (DUF6632)
MSAANRVLYLRIALIVIGLIFIFGIYPLSIIWPSGWAWGQGHSHYLMKSKESKVLLTLLCPAMTALPMLDAFASRNPRGIPIIAGEVMVRYSTTSATNHGPFFCAQLSLCPSMTLDNKFN